MNFASQLSMNSLGVMWQVLFKGFQELQNGYHLFQLGEMVIIRLIYINNKPNPEEYTKEIPPKHEINNQSDSTHQEIKKKN